MEQNMEKKMRNMETRLKACGFQVQNLEVVMFRGQVKGFEVYHLEVSLGLYL